MFVKQLHVLSELGASLSSEHIIVMAALRFPSSSSILAETALASKVAASGFLTGVWLTVSWSRLAGSTVRFLITEARLCRLPHLEGWISTSRPKLSRSVHA